MLLFGVYFILYFLKLPNVYCFWSYLGPTDKDTNIAKACQKILKKLMKIKHEVHFLHEYKPQGVYPIFVKWENNTAKFL